MCPVGIASNWWFFCANDPSIDRSYLFIWIQIYKEGDRERERGHLTSRMRGTWFIWIWFGFYIDYAHLKITRQLIGRAHWLKFCLFIHSAVGRWERKHFVPNAGPSSAKLRVFCLIYLVNNWQSGCTRHAIFGCTTGYLPVKCTCLLPWLLLVLQFGFSHLL